MTRSPVTDTADRSRGGCSLLRSLAPFLFFAFNACEPACQRTQEHPLAGHTDAVRVESCGPGAWEGQPAWEVVEELRIGQAEGEGPAVFSRVQSITSDEEGHIYVADSRPLRVEVFASDGAHLRTVGREGRGPGEFRWPAGLAVDSRRNLWVADFANRRYSIFDSTGGHVGTPPRTAAFSSPWEGRMEGDRLIEHAVSPDLSDARVEVRDLELNLLESIPVPVAEWDDVPFGPAPIMALGPQGVTWAGETDPYRLVRRDATGRVTGGLARPLTGDPLSRRQRREAVEQSMSQHAQVAALAGVEVPEGAAWDWRDLPEHRPILGAIWIDDTGYLWVRLHGERGADGRSFEIFDEAGVFLGELMLPFPMKLGTQPHFRGDLMYAVTTDEMGRDFVVRARVGRGGGGGGA